MLVLCYIFVILLNVFCLSLRKKLLLVDCISLIFLVVLVGGNSFNADYLGYEDFYLTQDNSNFEIGFLYFIKIFISIGLDYQSFLITTFTILYLFLYFTIKSLKSNFSFFVIFYLLTLSFLDAVQVRQSICFVFFTISIICKVRKRYIRAVLSFIFAGCIQKTVILFLPLVLLMNRRKLSNKWFFLILAVLLLSLVTIMNHNQIPFVFEIASLVISQDKLVYFTTATHFGFIIFYLFEVVVLVLAFIQYKTINKNFASNSKMKVFSLYIVKIALYSTIILPLTIMNSNFGRILKFPLLGMFITYSYIFYDLLKNKQHKVFCSNFLYISRGKMIILCCIFFIAYTISIQVFSVVQDVFTYNFFLGT